LGKIRPGLTLKFNQGLRIFGRVFSYIPSPFSNVTPPLTPGATVHFIDSETGVELPFIIPVGYTLTSISVGSSFNQDAMIWGYFEGFLRTSVGAPVGGSIFYEAEVITFGSSLLDPTAESAHPIDVQITNRGGG
ncbi:unnamed protein product, partial [marine sediment metagenome]